ncbi:MAG: hypothetical protein PHI68_06365, partial [Candidatus Cloacimonetes bacterium]|nr:hypothetical protein [Candidatus Cloacimonadota bacterium]
MEEYFKSAFEIADQEDPEIDFSSFQHFMIIHAGSDWQHDVNGDSPSDIPSFFIKVVEGKEAVVEGGNVRISHACNVPAMISQDFDSFTDSGQVVHTGYGALNAVITHEFGHSLGLVDLYNTFNSQPMVGVFDIMDSGGSGIMVDQNNDGEWIFVEGALPALPGAFSRILIFGDYYKQNGYLKELHELPFDTDIQLAASSHKQTSANLIPSILKIPLSPTEYILVENRSVDPDRDGGTAVWSDLNRRVAVYPTAIEDPNNIPTYEYDYLLPSFVNVDNESFGGGVLVWHVDENIIYNEGTVGSDGVFYSNYENNSVNTSYRRRGVKIIEADNLPDLGNVYSYYWTGTPYEYFHKNKPNLDSHGLFLNWSLQPWNNKLDALSKPALMDNSGTPCFYGVKDIGIPSAIMNLKIGSAFFDNTQTINLSSPIRSSAFPIGSSFTNLPELPLFTDNELVLFTHQIQPGFPDWTNQLGEFDYHWQVPDYPTSISDLNQNGYSEIMLTRDDTINLLEFANDSFTVKSISCEQPFVTPPLFLNGSLWAATADKLYQYTDQDEQEYLFSGVQALLGFQDQLYILRENQLLTYSGSGDFQTLSNLPEKFGVYEPIIFVDQNSSDAIMVFLVSDNGNIYKYIPGKLELIFQNRETVLPTQLGIMSFGETSPVLFFGLGEHVFALKHDGTSLPMFPGLISAQASKPQAHPKALKLSDTNIMLIPTQQGYLAFDQNARLLPGFSLVWDEDGGENYFYWEEQSQNLYWYNIPNSGQVLIHKLGGQSENPIVYQGFRNAGTGTVIAPLTDPDPIDENFTAYIYPNPIKSGHFRIRLENSRGD